MELTELLPELIKDLAPTGPLPTEHSAQFAYWRQLITTKKTADLPKGYLTKEDQLLEFIWKKRDTLELIDFEELSTGIYLTQGDLTQVKADAIVDPCSPHMLGCFKPEHVCLDNEIHVFAGSRLRQECTQMMQGTVATVGQARITKGYHLPAKYVIHTLPPQVKGNLTAAQRKTLENCYHACFTLALEYQLKSLAFSCLATGSANFPNDVAAKIAISSAKRFHQKHPELKIIFNTYKDIDYNLYRYLLTQR